MRTWLWLIAALLLSCDIGEYDVPVCTPGRNQAEDSCDKLNQDPLDCQPWQCVAGRCARRPRDADRDGVMAQACGGADCDDNNAERKSAGDCSCQEGATESCWETELGQALPKQGECLANPGKRACQRSGVWGQCLGAKRPDLERCDEKDNDCNGQVDEPYTFRDETGKIVSLGQACTVGKGACRRFGTVICNREHTLAKCSEEPGKPTDAYSKTPYRDAIGPTFDWNCNGSEEMGRHSPPGTCSSRCDTPGMGCGGYYMDCGDDGVCGGRWWATMCVYKDYRCSGQGSISEWITCK